MLGIYDHIGRKLRKLKRARRENSWVACCPAHDDRHPSLYLFIGRRGELVARCLSNRGCTWARIAAELDTRPQDWWPPKDDHEKQRRRRTMSDQIEAVYNYRDEAGRLLFQTVRYRRPSAVRFRQRRPATPQDALRPASEIRWLWDLQDTPLALYRLPELLAAPAQPVLIVEGEKDVETLRRLGFVATTSPCGAAAWRPDYARWLKGRRVVILPDNDEPGERYAALVAGSCLAWNCASIRVVRLNGLPEGGDVSDWVEDSLPHVTDEQKRAALIEAVKAAPEYRSVLYFPQE